MDLDDVLWEGARPGQTRQCTHRGGRQGVAMGYCWKDGGLLQGYEALILQSGLGDLGLKG